MFYKLTHKNFKFSFKNSQHSYLPRLPPHDYNSQTLNLLWKLELFSLKRITHVDIFQHYKVLGSHPYAIGTKRAIWKVTKHFWSISFSHCAGVNTSQIWYRAPSAVIILHRITKTNRRGHSLLAHVLGSAFQTCTGFGEFFDKYREEFVWRTDR